MKRLLLALILLPQVAFAATNETQYVRSGCTNNGDGTTSACAASGGAAGAFQTLAIAEAQNRNLVAQDVNLTIEVHGTGADTDKVFISGWTTDATRKLLITCGAGSCHSGVWSNSIYRLDYGTDADGHTIEINDPNVTIRGMQLKRSHTGSFIGGVVSSDTDSKDTVLDGNIIWKVASASTQDSYNGAIEFWNNEWHIVNNIIINDELSSKAVYIRPGGAVGWKTTIYNNTVIGGKYGLLVASYDADAGSLLIKNNLLYGSATADWSEDGGNSLTTATNATEDATSPQAGLRNRTFTFVGGGDYHLASGDTGAQTQGTDLSGDSQYPLSTDIDGNTRSGTWDIGADEVASASGMNLLLLHAEGY